MRHTGWILFLMIGVGSLAAAEPRAARVLIVGGGSSHNFDRWWNKADSTILAETTDAHFEPTYTSNPISVAPMIGSADVLLLATNQPGFSAPAIRTALQAHADAGKGIVLLHAGVWYNFKDWPEFNETYVGGGARGHDKLGEFEVTVTRPDHPLMKGIPAKFKVTDELYHTEVDPKGSPIEVLATATSQISGKTFPSIWIVKHPKARIAAIALGHDGRVHDSDAYKTLLRNAAGWAVERR